jgi:hypothetical protein
MKNKEPIEFYKVDVESISLPDWLLVGFSSERITRIADSIVETGELITPLLVRRTGLITYEILNEWNTIYGFYAIKEARKRDLRKFEMVNVFVVADDYVERVINQRNNIRGVNQNDR